MLLDSQHLHSFEMSVLRLAAWLVLLMLIFLPLERLLAVRPKKFFGKGLGRAAIDREAGAFDHRTYRPLLIQGKTVCVVGAGGIGLEVGQIGRAHV